MGFLTREKGDFFFSFFLQEGVVGGWVRMAGLVGRQAGRREGNWHSVCV